LNDADAAGLAEMRYGVRARATRHGGDASPSAPASAAPSSSMASCCRIPSSVTWSSAARKAERRASAQARKNAKLSWPTWSARLSEVLVVLEDLLWPDLFILGGGVSRKPENFLPLLTCRTPVVPAALGNDAGIVGAALAAAGGLAPFAPDVSPPTA
jgi:polyphosphate glucokinase